MVPNLTGIQEVAGSNPITPTIVTSRNVMVLKVFGYFFSENFCQLIGTNWYIFVLK